MVDQAGLIFCVQASGLAVTLMISSGAGGGMYAIFGVVSMNTKKRGVPPMLSAWSLKGDTDRARHLSVSYRKSNLLKQFLCWPEVHRVREIPGSSELHLDSWREWFVRHQVADSVINALAGWINEKPEVAIGIGWCKRPPATSGSPGYCTRCIFDACRLPDHRCGDRS